MASEYTQEQFEGVKNILRKSDLYDILGVPKNFNESQLRKAYRKVNCWNSKLELAIKFHPDKNRAPKAEEAFKKVKKNC